MAVITIKESGRWQLRVTSADLSRQNNRITSVYLLYGLGIRNSAHPFTEPNYQVNKAEQKTRMQDVDRW